MQAKADARVKAVGPPKHEVNQHGVRASDLEAVEEAEAATQKCGVRFWSAELHRLRAVFLTTIGAEEIKLRLRSAKPSESQRSRNRFR